MDAVNMKKSVRCPSEQEKAAREFPTGRDYRDAKMQAQDCADMAEDIRSSLYDTAVSAMNIAGDESSKWATIKQKLANSELDGYRDVVELRIKAAKRYEECVAAEQEAKRRIEEKHRREAEAAEAKKKRNTLLGILATVLVIASVLVVNLVIIPEKNYRDAVALQQAGKYEEAISAFESLNGYSDSETQINETKYLKAKDLTELGDYAGAVSVFGSIKGYKDVDILLKNDNNLSAAARDTKYSVGNYVTIGHYPQTSEGTDSTLIEWLVVARDGQKVLLLSRYGLDAQPYYKEWTSITWERCTLRTWLNETFLNKAFTTQEQTGILLTNVDNSRRQGYSGWTTSGGNNTQDKVFLLSYTEANKYLGVTYDNSNNMESRIAPTDYAVKHRAYSSSNDKTSEGRAAGWWWLRSPGEFQYSAARVHTGGSLSGSSVEDSSGCVRPALWINLESDIF